MNASMSDANAALQDLIGGAQQEIADALLEQAAQDAAALRQRCADHLDNIVWAASQAGLDDLYLVAEAVLAGLGEAGSELDTERGADFLDWLAAAGRYLQAPDDPALLDALLTPLADDTRAALAAILGSTDTAAATADAQSGAVETALAATETPAAALDPDDILGMLAHELREVSPQLAALAQSLALAADEAELEQTLAAYREIVGRVASVAQELELDGLAMICAFVDNNLTLCAALPAARRDIAIDLLQHWPPTVIEHLLDPDNDAKCIAVIDFLETETWPEPLPYRDLRALIEGLTRASEASVDHEPELRAIEAVAEDVSLELSGDASPELIEAFFDESPGHAETFSSLMAAINRGEDIQSSVEAAQRIAHTLKGSGNLVGVRGIANLAHHTEDILDYIARHRITPPPPLAQTLQEAADTSEAMIEALQGMAPAPDDALRVLQDVLDWANRIDSGRMRQQDYAAAPAPTNRPAEPATAPADADAAADDAAALAIEERRSSSRGDEPAVAIAGADSVRVPLKLLDDIFRIVSETAVTSGQIQERLNRLESSEKLIRNNDSSMQQLRYELENLVSIRAMASRHRGSIQDGSGDFDPLEMDEYDEFYGATHAFIESVADSREILRGFSGEVYELDALFDQQQRLNKELQQMVMTTRLVPVSSIAARLQRTLRQVCRATGKQAELSILGQDLLLDGDVLNKIADPLMHMLRNAVDHGIESADTRAARGKPAQGRVELRFQQQGNNVVVECSDDGAGLDYERIRWIALERGLLDATQAVDDAALAGLILQSGFSTRDEITHVSGRGVGMDVVHNTIRALNGSMDIGDAPGGGTRVSLRLPITLLTSHCLLVGVLDTVYAIPTLALTQILSPGTGQLGLVDGKLRYQLEQDVYPAYTLNSLVGAAESGAADSYETSDVLLLPTPDGIAAVGVERVVTSADLVVKNMGAYIKSVSGIAGVSMLGDGAVVAVLDLPAMLKAQSNRAFEPRLDLAAAPSSAPRLPCVMIVDDSLSVRNSLAQLMQDSGYRALLARDGREAVTLLDSDLPDVVLTDLEMPRMNGLELVSYIRNSERCRELPVVMITSRNMSKHRQQAQQAGVNLFIPKPFSDDDVLDAIDRQLATTVPA